MIYFFFSFIFFLKKGDYFGEEMIFSEKEIKYSARSVQLTSLLFIKKKDFNMSFDLFPNDKVLLFNYFLFPSYKNLLIFKEKF